MSNQLIIGEILDAAVKERSKVDILAKYLSEAMDESTWATISPP